MKNNGDKIRRWEAALALSLCLTVFHGFALEPAGAAWWGVIFPGLTGAAPGQVETVKLDGAGGVEVRFWLLDWLEGVLGHH